MKLVWIVSIIMPVVLFGRGPSLSEKIPLLSLETREKSSEDLIETEGLESLGLSFLEIEENDESLLPWVEEGFNSLDFSVFMDKNLPNEGNEEAFLEELFSKSTYAPSLEPSDEEIGKLVGKFAKKKKAAPK